MHRPFSLTAALAAGLLSGSELHAQRHGPTSNLAVAVSLEQDHNGKDEVWMKPPEPQGGAVAHVGAVPVGVTNYTLQSRFPAYADIIEIDAEGTGNAIIPSRVWNDQRSPDFDAAQSWMGVVISVRNDSEGQEDSLIEKRLQRTTGRTKPGADLIGFYMEKSVGISSDLVGKTVLEHTAEDFGFQGVEEIDSLDFGMGVITHAQDAPLSTFFVRDEQYFFSLSPDCVQNVNGRALDLGTPFVSDAVEADAASIYQIDWTGSAWTQPKVFKTAEKLGLNGSSENLDALSVDSQTGRVIFSAEGISSSCSQLRFYTPFGKSSTVVDYVTDLGDGDGGLAADKLGTNDETDDIDAVCIADPESGTFGTHFGVPLLTPLAEYPQGPPLGLSTARGVSVELDQDSLYFEVTGFDEDLDSLEGTVFLLIQDGFGYDLSTAWITSNWYVLGAAGRRNAEESIHFSYLTPPPATTNGLAFLAYFVSDDGLTEKVSWVSAVKIQ